MQSLLTPALYLKISLYKYMTANWPLFVCTLHTFSMLQYCRNCYSPGSLWTHCNFWSWRWNRSKHMVRHQTCRVAMGTGHSRDPSDSYTEQPPQESRPSGWWTDQDWSWCGSWCTAGCWRVWIFHSSTHCLGMYHDEEMSFEYMSSWNRHTGKWTTFFYTQNTVIIFISMLPTRISNQRCQV